MPSMIRSGFDPGTGTEFLPSLMRRPEEAGSGLRLAKGRSVNEFAIEIPFGLR